MSRISEPLDRVGVLLVPGIGASRSGRELIVFAEAVLGWLERADAPQRDNDLLGPSQRRVELRHTRLEPAGGDPPQTVLVVNRGAEGPLEIVITEAQWPARLQSPAAGMLGRWLVRVLPFLLLDMADTAVLRDVRRFGRRPWHWWRIAAGLLGLFIAAPLALAVVAVVATTLVLTWLHIPGFDQLGRWLALQLSRMFGDSYLLTTSPVQADAAVEAVRREIDGLTQRCPTVAVVGFAQGAAVAHAAVRRHRSPALRLLVTVGSGLRKYHEIPAASNPAARPWEALFVVCFALYFLSGPIWVGSLVLADPSPGSLAFGGFYALVHGGLVWSFFTSQYGHSTVVDTMTYALPGAGSAITWVDYYASADLVAGGPVIDPIADPPLGWPHEIPVYNNASWFGDHGSYLANVDGFLGDLIPRLMRPFDADRPPEPRQTVAIARRFWRVQWLVAARLLAVLSGVAVLVRVSGSLDAIGTGAAGMVPNAVTRLLALAVKAFAELPLPSASPSAVGILIVALATGATYAVLLLTWRRWDRRDIKRYLAGAEPDAGGWPFAVFLAALLITTLVGVDAVGSLFQSAGPVDVLVDGVAAVPLPPEQLLVVAVLTFLAGAMYRGTASAGADEEPSEGGARFMLRLFSGALVVVVAYSLVAPGSAWSDEGVKPTRLGQLPGILVGGVAGFVVGEAVRRFRYVLAVHVRPWIVRSSVVGASAMAWGRIPPQGAELLRTLPFGGAVTRLTPNGRHLLIASAGRATLREMHTGRPVARFPWTGELAAADELVAQAGEGTIRVRAIGAGTWGDIAAADAPPGDPAMERVTALAFSPDGRLLVSAHAGGEIRVYDVQDRVELWRGEGAARTKDVAAGPGGQMAVACDGRVQLWRQGEKRWEMRHEWTDEPYPKRVAFDATGVRLAVATSDSAVLLRDCASGAEIARLRVRGGGGVGAVAFHPTDTAVVVAVGDEVRLWYPGVSSQDIRLYPNKGDVRDLEFDRDGHHMVVGCLDATTVWRWCDRDNETW